MKFITNSWDRTFSETTTRCLGILELTDNNCSLLSAENTNTAKGKINLFERKTFELTIT